MALIGASVSYYWENYRISLLCKNWLDRGAYIGVGDSGNVETFWVLDPVTFNPDYLSEIPDVKHVRTIGLYRCNISDAHLKYLIHATALETLVLSNTNVGDSGMAILIPLERLRELNVTNTNVSDSSVQSLTKLSSLETIIVVGAQFSEQGLDVLRKRGLDVQR